MRGTAVTSFLAGLVGLVMPMAAFGQTLPPGPGSDVVAQVCSACHGLDQITSQRHDAAGWQDVVSQMIDNGAVASDAQKAQIISYLATNFGFGPPPAAAAAKTPSAAQPDTGTAHTPSTSEAPN